MSFLWRWARRALGVTAAAMAAFVVVAALVGREAPEPSAEAPFKIMGVPLVRADGDSDGQQAWQAEVSYEAAAAPAETSPEERVAQTLSRPDDPGAQEPWPAAAITRHARLRDLYREFVAFRDSAEFRRYGFGRGGRFAAWHDRVAGFDGDATYMSLLYDRCGVIPDDLRRHARDRMNGKAGPQVKADAAAWVACFPD